MNHFKRSTLFIILFIASFTVFSQKNLLNTRDYWKTKPTISQVKEKIKEGHDASELTKYGFDAVVYSLLENADAAITKHLLTEKGNDVNKLTHDGRTYIFWAAYKNNMPIVKHLLANNAKTDVIDDKGYSLFNFTAVAGVQNTDLYDLIIENSANISEQKTPYGANPLLLIAPSLDDSKMIDYFISKGLSIDATDTNGNGIFNYASKKDNRKILELLIKKGLPYKDLNKNGGNAMLFATKGSRHGYNSLAYFKYLENLGINPNITNKEGKTPLHNLATRNKDIPSINYFIDKGVNVNQVDDKGNTALILASKRNSLEVISLFIDKTKDINVTNKKGHSALTDALANKTEVVQLLIDKGATVSVVDTKGNNLAYHLFKNFKSKEKEDFEQKLALLTKQGLKVASPQKDGTNLYHIAVEKNSIEMFDYIKKYDIDINAKNKKGLTAIQQAVMTAKNHKIIKCLLANGADKNVTTDFDETLFNLAKENEALTNTSISYLK